MSEAIDDQAPRRYVSERGRFEIFSNTRINQPGPRRPVDVDKTAEYFEHSALAAKYGEQPVREKIAAMAESIQGGAATTVLFSQDAPNGMSLVHVWFGNGSVRAPDSSSPMVSPINTRQVPLVWNSWNFEQGVANPAPPG
jgi:hypothetical protein